MRIFCPRCGQEQASTEIRFCSKCGFVLQGIADVVLKGGLPDVTNPTGPKPRSPRNKGIRQGAVLFLLGILFVPIVAILQELFRFPDEIIAVAAVLFFVGGIVRILFAAILESGDPGKQTIEEKFVDTAQKVLDQRRSAAALPPQQQIPAEHYMPPTAPNWRETNDLERVSVTDNTTKLLSEEKTNDL